YTVKKDLDHVDACHCNMCRRWSGGVHFGVDLAPDELELEGTENIATYTSSEWAERAFCKICGSHLYYRFTMEGPACGTYSLSAGSLDDMNGLPLKKEIYVDAKPDGFAFTGEHPRMTEAEFLTSIGVTP
ncbi:MAG: GFA family protein, partial [Pseudomonadota bacterium]